jgi:hemerythrin superfamily protein
MKRACVPDFGCARDQAARLDATNAPCRRYLPRSAGTMFATCLSHSADYNAMPTAKKKAATRSRRKSPSRKQDAVALLEAEHRQVENWFKQFEASRADERKQTLANQICQALKVHTQIEAEIFYPAFLEATEETGIHHEAQVEHGAAKKLLEEIEASGPDDEYYQAKVTVLSEMIKHHVNEEEKRGGMFAKARQSDMDLAALGEQLAQRKAALMQGTTEDATQGRSR